MTRKPPADLQWSTAKPKEPGTYWTRHDTGTRSVLKSPPVRVVVRRVGRGLRVVPDGPWPPERMSDIEDGELEWAKVEEE